MTSAETSSGTGVRGLFIFSRHLALVFRQVRDAAGGSLKSSYKRLYVRARLDKLFCCRWLCVWRRGAHRSEIAQCHFGELDRSKNSLRKLRGDREAVLVEKLLGKLRPDLLLEQQHNIRCGEF